MKNKIKILELKTKKILNSGLFWNYKSKLTWAWMEFAEHREYNFWDNVRDIDWKASAKTDVMQVKKYEQEKDLNVLFVLDNSNSMQFWSIEKTKKDLLEEIFFTLSMSAYYSNDNVWALIFDEKKSEFIEYKKSKNNIYKIVEELSPHSVSPKGREVAQNNLNKILKNIIDRKTKNNLIFVITDKTEGFDIKDLKLIWEQNDLVLINIFDYLENFPHPNPLPWGRGDLFWNISINFWKEFLNIDLSDKNKIFEFQEYRKKKLEKLKYNLEKNNIWYLQFETTQDIYKELFKFFNKR